MKANRHPRYQFIDTTAELENMVTRLETEKAIAVDLEADSMFHFNEKVCLIQIASEQTCFIIDPLAIKGMAPLKPLFFNTDIQKIFHGADYDIRCLYRDFRIRVMNLFDTQLACRFLGINETGLDAVILKRFNVQLDKKYQKKDWSRRPLSAVMLAYAAKDVLFLVALGKELEKELEKKGRLSWVYEESRRLSKIRPPENDTVPLFVRFKGAGKMDSRELAILEAILIYRQKVAQKKDLPVFKIFGNQSILKMVEARPLDIARLEKTQALSRKQIHRYGNDLLKSIHSALQVPAADLPSYPRKKAPIIKTAVRKRIRALKCWRDQKAKALAIDSALICSKALMADIAATNPNSMSRLNQIKQLKNWQKNVWGKEILTILREADGRKN